ncbi:cytochrome C oxidase subunit II [Paenibacillus thailandensis]|uniref:Cytochrome C oxidase subunit II n=1 Tax=Paenibacillus thailandensis TaxID=393250 RepID=A0ABW5QTD3_9BACL
MKKWIWFGAVFLLVFALAACGGNNNQGAGNDANNGGAANGTTDNGAGAGAGAEEGGGATTTAVAVKAKNWEFDQAEYRIPKGTDITLSLESTEGIHGLAIRNTDYTVENGASTTVNLAEAGEYELYCNVPCGTGHSKMVSKIIVE